MKTTINSNTREAIGGIIQGLFYLSREAENADLHSIRNLLITVIDDINGWADNSQTESDKCETSAIITNSSFLSAIQFLSKFASIKDSKLKKEIIEEIRKCEATRSNNIKIFPLKNKDLTH